MPSLEITTMIGCPLMCTYCPQDTLKAAYRGSGTPVNEKQGPAPGAQRTFLSLEDFRTVLAKVPESVRIDFAGMAEPWANPDATQMLESALTAGRSVAIYTTLSGIRREECQQILGLLHDHVDQLEILCLHLPDANGSMRGWKHSNDYESNLKDFIDFGNRELSNLWVRESATSTSPRFQVMTMDGTGKIHRQLSHLGISTPAWRGNTRAGTLAAAPEKTPSLNATPTHHAAVSCSWTPFYDRNVLLPNGDVVLCCMDYALKHVIGNLLTGDYESLFRSEEMTKLRFINSQPSFSKCSLCKSCDDAQVYKLERTSWFKASDPGFEIVGLASDGWLTPDAELRVYVAQARRLHLKLQVPDWLPAAYPFDIRFLRGAAVLESIPIYAPGTFEIDCDLSKMGTIRIEGGQWFRPRDLPGGSEDDRYLCLKLDEQAVVS